MLAACATDTVGRALALMHGVRSQRWTTTSCARGRLSRSACTGFTAMVGKRDAYLTQGGWCSRLLSVRRSTGGGASKPVKNRKRIQPALSIGGAPPATCAASARRGTRVSAPARPVMGARQPSRRWQRRIVPFPARTHGARGLVVSGAAPDISPHMIGARARRRRRHDRWCDRAASPRARLRDGPRLRPRGRHRRRPHEAHALGRPSPRSSERAPDAATSQAAAREWIAATCASDALGALSDDTARGSRCGPRTRSDVLSAPRHAARPDRARAPTGAKSPRYGNVVAMNAFASRRRCYGRGAGAAHRA